MRDRWNQKIMAAITQAKVRFRTTMAAIGHAGWYVRIKFSSGCLSFVGDVLLTNIDFKEVKHDRYYLLNRSAHHYRELYSATCGFY